jgi:hypothetical protein
MNAWCRGKEQEFVSDRPAHIRAPRSGNWHLIPRAYERAAIEAEKSDREGTPGMGRGEIVAPARSYEVDLRPDPARPPPLSS